MILMIFVCDPCGWKYDEEKGDPENGIEPGTKFVNLDDLEFACPICGAGKAHFSKVR